MRVHINPRTYAEWIPGARTINFYTFTLYGDDPTSMAWGARWANTDCCSFGYDKDRRPTQAEALAALLRYLDEGVYSLDNCPACGKPFDYCQGHGRIGDPAGYHVVLRHEYADHSHCHPSSNCKEN
jgi:hypothetical protein